MIVVIQKYICYDQTFQDVVSGTVVKNKTKQNRCLNMQLGIPEAGRQNGENVEKQCVAGIAQLTSQHNKAHRI